MNLKTEVRFHLLVVALLGVVLCLGSSGVWANEDVGRAVFVSKGCAVCHEERAVLQAPHVSVLRKDRSPFQLAAAMWNHAPMMWANLPEAGLKWPRLAVREMAELSKYLNGSVLDDPAPNPSQGQLVLVDKGCLFCHELAGPRGTTARDLAGQFRADSSAAWAAALWNHAPTMLALGVEQRIPYPSMDWRDMVDMIGFLREVGKPR